MNKPRAYTVEEHYSPMDAARLLHVGRSTIYKLIQEGARSEGAAGIFPVRRIGAATRIPATALNRYLATCPVGTGLPVGEVAGG